MRISGYFLIIIFLSLHSLFFEHLSHTSSLKNMATRVFFSSLALFISTFTRISTFSTFLGNYTHFRQHKIFPLGSYYSETDWYLISKLIRQMPRNPKSISLRLYRMNSINCGTRDQRDFTWNTNISSRFLRTDDITSQCRSVVNLVSWRGIFVFIILGEGANFFNRTCWNY